MITSGRIWLRLRIYNFFLDFGSFFSFLPFSRWSRLEPERDQETERNFIYNTNQPPSTSCGFERKLSETIASHTKPRLIRKGGTYIHTIRLWSFHASHTPSGVFFFSWILDFWKYRVYILSSFCFLSTYAGPLANLKRENWKGNLNHARGSQTRLLPRTWQWIQAEETPLNPIDVSTLSFLVFYSLIPPFFLVHFLCNTTHTLFKVYFRTWTSHSNQCTYSLISSSWLTNNNQIS